MSNYRVSSDSIAPRTSGGAIRLRIRATDKETRGFLEDVLYWEFDPKEDTTSCPEASRELPYNHKAKQKYRRSRPKR